MFWTSRSLQIHQAGYLDYGDRVCKLHRVHWIDVTFISTFGQTIPNVIAPKFKMVKYDNLTIRKKFNKSYETQIVQNKTLHRVTKLCANLIPLQALSRSQIEKYKKIDNSKQHAIKIASKKCRK